MAEKREGVRKGFSKNPLLLLLDLIDTPGNVLRGGIRSLAEGDDLLKGAAKSITRKEVTTGADINKSLGITTDKTSPLVAGAAGLATSLGVGALTAPAEVAAIGSVIKGAKNIGSGVKEVAGLKSIANIADLAPVTRTTQKVGRKVGEGVRKILAEKRLDPRTGKTVLQETRLQNLKENRSFSKAFRPVASEVKQKRKDIFALTKGVEKRNIALQQRINKLNLPDDVKEQFKLALLSNINATSGLDDIPRLSAGNVLDKFLDSLDIGRGKKDVIPDLGKVGRRQLFSKGITLNKEALSPENSIQLQSLLDTINEPLRQRTGIEKAFTLQESLDGKTVSARLNSKAIQPLLRDPSKLQNQDVLNTLIEGIGTKANTAEEKKNLFQNVLGQFAGLAKQAGIGPGDNVADVLTTLEQFNLKDIKTGVDSTLLKNISKLQKSTRKATKLSPQPLLEQFQKLSTDINTDPNLFKQFGETAKLGTPSTKSLDDFLQVLRTDPRLIGQEKEITGIFEEAKNTLLEARKQAGESALFVGKGKFAAQQAKGFKEGSFIPRLGDFRTTEIDRLASTFDIDPNLLDRALPVTGKMTPEIKNITDNFFKEGLSAEQTFALRDDILKNEELFKEFSGDRGSGKQALESLVDGFQRVKKENKLRVAKGLPLKTVPEIDINNIVRGQLRGAINNGPEESAFINLIKQHGKPMRGNDVFSDGVWKPIGEAIDDVSDFVPLNIESLPLQNNKSALWRTQLLKDLGIDPTQAGAKEILLPKEVHEIVREIGNGRHLDSTLGLNPLRDKQLFKRMSDRTKSQTSNVVNTLGELTGKVMNTVRKVVIMTPGYHFRNQFGQMQNMYLSGLSPDDIAKYYPSSLSQWTKLWKDGRKNPTVLKDMLKNDRFRTYLQTFDRSPITFEQNWNIDPESVLKIIQNRTVREVSEGASTSRFALGKQGLAGNIDNILKDNLDLTIATDHASRFAVFDRALDKLQPLIKQGTITTDEANKRAIKEAAQIVFSRLDLGPDANDMMRNLFLFSGWTINNTKKVLREISSDPATLQRYLGVIKVTRGLQQNLGGEENLSDFALARGRFSIPAFGKNLKPKVLDSTAIQGLGNLVNPFAGAAQALSPALKLPIELGTGRNLATGQEIKSVPRQILTSGLGLQNPLRLLDLLAANTPVRKGLEAPATPDVLKNFFDLSEKRDVKGLLDLFNNIPGNLFSLE